MLTVTNHFPRRWVRQCQRERRRLGLRRADQQATRMNAAIVSDGDAFNPWMMFDEKETQNRAHILRSEHRRLTDDSVAKHHEAVVTCERAARAYAAAHRSDPFAYSTAMSMLRNGAAIADDFGRSARP